MKQKQLIREKFREAVFKRDNHRCKCCGRKDVRLDAHHITDRNEMPNGGYVKENGITLCDTSDGCHFKAEKYHSSGKKEGVPGFLPDDLYSLIGSTYEKAVIASEKLSR